MISLIIPIKNKKSNLKKSLMSVLLQVCNKDINIIVVFKSQELKNYYNNIISLFDNKLKIKVIIKNNLLMQSALNLCDNKYVMFLKENDFFYDAFSVDSLIKCIVNNEYDFVYGNSVILNEDYSYSSVDNEYLLLTGKLFSIDYLSNNNNICIDNENSDYNIDFVSKCFLLSSNYLYVDSIVCVNNSFDYSIVNNLEVIVNSAIDIYYLFNGKIQTILIKNYINNFINYIYKIFINNMHIVSLSDFNRIIVPLEKVCKELFIEV